MSLLAGIKVGKKKKCNQPPLSSDVEPVRQHSTGKLSDRNASVAEQFRQSLAAGRPLLNDQKDRLDDDYSKVLVMPTEKIPGKSEEEMTIQDMVAEEREWTLSQSESDVRNILRVGRKRNMKMSKTVDSDEEEERQTQLLADKSQKKYERDVSRHLSQNNKLEKISSKCWWWLDSSSFERHRLLALGDHVTMIMAPPNLSLTPGEHFYLVPIKHAESLTQCEDEVWDEIIRFQTSLRNLYRSEGKDVLFCETVLPNSGFWQTKFEAIPVPRRIAEDAPLYFTSSLREQAEEWGTHQKLMKIDKGLRRTIPKKFPYFFLEYEQGRGYAQLIESNVFPREFGVDTISGMMELDPIRVKRKEKSSTEQERQYVLKFLEKWKSHDWTKQLDV